MQRTLHRSRYATLLLTAAVITAISGHLAADDAAIDRASTESAASASHAASQSPSSQAASVAEASIVFDKTTSKPIVERIDNAFKLAVELMNEVLFYRVGSQDRPYVVYINNLYYIRTRGSDGPFELYGNYDASVAKSLTPANVQALAAGGLLITGANDANYRPAQIGDRKVDCVTVKQNGDGGRLTYGAKYVFEPNDDVPSTPLSDWLQEGVYRKVGPLRGLLSETETLTPTDVTQLGKEGLLKKDAEQAFSGAPPYILSERHGGAPVVVLWLSFGAVFFTIYMRGFNIWGFRHALEVVRGRYDDPNETGEVTHFQALASALSATVGLGNIAGVTIAMTVGGPGAFFWMILCGIFGMTSKFTECTLGQKFRKVKPDGTVLGGPMQYLSVGLEQLGWGLPGKILGTTLSIVFAVMCILASFGGGNMFQANQSGGAVLAQWQRADTDQLGDLESQIRAAGERNDPAALETLQAERSALQAEMKSFEKLFRQGFGFVLACLVAVVIIGGIRRIGAAAEKLVPSMCLIYVTACLWIIFAHLPEIPGLVASIFTQAFTGTAMSGGLIGVLVVGVQRAAFSNEAGVGSAAIAHSAAKTDEPVREGTVALLGPFIDTVVVCSMTALVILITGAWNRQEWIVDEGLSGAALTSIAFRSEIEWFPWVLSVAVVLFAYSTIISWSYYGEKSWERLFGPRSVVAYRVLAVMCVFIGAVVHAGAVLDFSDMMILSMAFPNILGVLLLAPGVRRDLMDYWKRYRNGEFRTFK